jgi:hypothetical protein
LSLGVDCLQASDDVATRRRIDAATIPVARFLQLHPTTPMFDPDRNHPAAPNLGLAADPTGRDSTARLGSVAI